LKWFRPHELASKFELVAQGKGVVSIVNVITSCWTIYVDGRKRESGMSSTTQGAKVQASRAATDYITIRGDFELRSQNENCFEVCKDRRD